MRRTFFIVTGVALWSVCAWAFVSIPRGQHDSKPHRHADAQALVNPLKPTADVLAAGKKAYERRCAECHGETGTGDGMAGEGMTPRPANLTDAAWEHGSTDGEIFTVIRDGSGDGMKSFTSKLTEQQMWEVVTYVRSLSTQAR